MLRGQHHRGDMSSEWVDLTYDIVKDFGRYNIIDFRVEALYID